ncbi:hypothetical protein XENTR_v10003170 [Xenopus tropicalis]|nr:hypothetical protein XENTR_v10003170 [Xenopus tropicalis]
MVIRLPILFPTCNYKYCLIIILFHFSRFPRLGSGRVAKHKRFCHGILIKLVMCLSGCLLAGVGWLRALLIGSLASDPANFVGIFTFCLSVVRSRCLSASRLFPWEGRAFTVRKGLFIRCLWLCTNKPVST